ncbi:hypothetical protein ACHAWF_015170 [Thalassiosira exigua]
MATEEENGGASSEEAGTDAPVVAVAPRGGGVGGSGPPSSRRSSASSTGSSFVASSAATPAASTPGATPATTPAPSPPPPVPPASSPSSSAAGAEGTAGVPAPPIGAPADAPSANADAGSGSTSPALGDAPMPAVGTEASAAPRPDAVGSDPAIASAVAGHKQKQNPDPRSRKPVTRGSRTNLAAAATTIARPPLNPYLRIAIVRDPNVDEVTCEDPERPGKTKRVSVGKLATERETVEGADDEDDERGGGGEAAAKKSSAAGDGGGAPTKEEEGSEPDSAPAEEEAKKKRDIPVPLIAAAKRYDRDVPPAHRVPSSYVRHVCPSYDEVVNETVEYDVDAEDERWWRENADFGPESEARIVPEEDEEHKKEPADDKTTAPGGEGGAPAVPEKPKTTVTRGAKSIVIDGAVYTKTKNGKYQNEKGKFVKRKALLEALGPEAAAMVGPGKKRAGAAATAAATGEGSGGTGGGTSGGGTSGGTSGGVSGGTSGGTGLTSGGTTPRSAPSTPRKEYTLEEALLLNPRYLHSRHSTAGLMRKYNPKLPLATFEKMIDALEKATGFESIVTSQQAEELLIEKMPELEDIFGPLSARDRARMEEDEERDLARWLPKGDDASKQKGLPSLAPPVTLPEVISQVYEHWVAKRSRLRKPLLRRYWPPTSAADTNPHQVFRQREGENRRRLRKKRQNDREAHRRMRRLRSDFERVRVLCDLIVRREEVGRTLVESTREYFEQRLYELTDTTGRPRRSALTEEEMQKALDVPKVFDDGPISSRGRKKRKRGSSHAASATAAAAEAESRGPSPVPHAGARTCPPAASSLALPPGSGPHTRPPLVPPLGLIPPPKNIVVAGHGGGLPAPNFLQPLATRESHQVTSWEHAVPSFPSYVDGIPTTLPDGFRHRPRLGRGGRIVIDRVPRPNPYAVGPGMPPRLPPPPTVVTYGSPPPRAGYDVAPLGTDGPNYTVEGSPDKYGPNRSPARRLEDGRWAPSSSGSVAIEPGKGTDASTAPKAPPAQGLLDLALPLPGRGGGGDDDDGDTDGDKATSLSRRIAEICARGLVEDQEAASATGTDEGDNDLDEVLVPIEDWMEAPAGAGIYGSEQFVVGPL